MNNEIQKELLQKQIPHVKPDWKLSFKDITKMSTLLPKSIFTDDCCIWNTGFALNVKRQYVHFYYKKKKVALHRILYENFVDNINYNDVLSRSCPNHRNCCSVKHYKIRTYNKKPEPIIIKKPPDPDIFKISFN